MSSSSPLVARALEGDGKAFSSLVKPHLGVLYRIALRACGDPSIAEDAVQEALTIAAQRLHKLHEGSSIRAFLAGIASRQAHTLLRSQRRRWAREERAPALHSPETPEEVASAAELAQRIRGALERLPRKRREAVLLRLDGKLTDVEIAQALGSSEASVRVLVHMGLKALREQLIREED